MYFSYENKAKLTISYILIALSVSTLLIGRTLVNTLIVTRYPVSILPYFYLLQAILLIIATALTSKYQSKNPQKFALLFKIITIPCLIIFSVAIQKNLPFAPFIISVMILIFTSYIATIPWNYAIEIFDIQEYKRYSKLLQASGTISAIATGVLINFLSAKFGLIALLLAMVLIESISIFCILPLSKYLNSEPIVTKNQANFSYSLKNNIIFKNLAFFTIASAIISTLIDYNFKLSLSTDIEKQNITDLVTRIYIISTVGTLLIQISFLDYLLRILGSKKIIIIFPLGILITAFITLFFPNFFFVAILVITNEILSYSTLALSKNLYLNTLPSSIRNLGLLKLSGIIKPISVGLASIIVFFLIALNNPRWSLALIVVSCFYLLYLTRILIKEYSSQLTKSVNLRCFNRELINSASGNSEELEKAINQALVNNHPETNIFGLQLLTSNKNLKLPNAIKALLHTKNTNLLRETAGILAKHHNEREFVRDAMDAFASSDDKQVRWYLALYLVEPGQNNLLPLADELIKSESYASLAIGCLIYMKQGNLNQQITAMTQLNKLLESNNYEQQKWFLTVLREIKQVSKEEYLINFISEGGPKIQSLALQQIGNAPSNKLLRILIENIGKRRLSYSLNKSLIKVGEPIIELLEDKFKKTAHYHAKISCILILTKIQGIKAEISLTHILSCTNDTVIKTVIAKYLAYRGVKNRISDILSSFLVDQIKTEVSIYAQLSNQSMQYNDPLVTAEINSRIQFIKIRVLYYLSAITSSIEILNTLSLITSAIPNQNQQAMAIELIDAELENRPLSAQVMILFTESSPKTIVTNDLAVTDPWLQEFLQKVESNNMESIYKITRLRTIDLFKNLSAETLQVLAECCISRDMALGEVIFKEGEHGDGLYIIDTGSVLVTKQDKVLSNLAAGDYFGELALLSDIPRFATVTATSEGALFYIDKRDFDRLTDELPEIMKNLVKQVISYFAVLPF